MSDNNANAQMFWNQGCSFAGSTSSYVAVRNSPELDITGSFTIEAWVNPVNVTSPAFQIILQKKTQKELSEQTGLNNVTISRMLNGARS